MKNKKLFLIAIIVTIGCCTFSVLSCTNNEKEKFNIGENFIPSGYMGCQQIININTTDTTDPHSGLSCISIAINSWKGCGGVTWAGVYWQNKESNWGNKQGENFSGKGFTKVTFWAKGQNGAEVVKFGSGGTIDNNMKYIDSYNERNTTEGKNVILSKQWKQYVINLNGADLSSVIGGFFFSVAENSNKDGLIFYLDDIIFE
jgi:hypothetical protein